MQNTMPQSKHKTLLSWSSGKDSAWALHTLRQDPQIELAGLFCTVNQAFNRVAMHGVRVELLQRQADRLGLPLQIIDIPYPCSNEQYAQVMSEFVTQARAAGVTHFAFGDLFLEDVRCYREERLQGTGISPIFPLWGSDTRELSQTMVTAGLRSVLTCVDPKQLSKDFAGRIFDATLLCDLPADVDPCGENGEFHSFAFDGPMFAQAVDFTLGETVARDGFVFTDLLP
ncbi:MAG: ATP-binding protein [Burkholderiaceae bacterium]